MAFQPMQKTAARPSKLRATAAFLEALARTRQDIVAFIDVAADGYIPEGVQARTILGPRRFTAVLPFEILDRLLGDDRVILIQPSEKLQPTSQSD